MANAIVKEEYNSPNQHHTGIHLCRFIDNKALALHHQTDTPLVCFRIPVL
jgi:hypothetical protein